MVISCHNIKKSFGVLEVLSNITFTIEEKEKVAIVGVNGAGKTTLLKILTDQDSADSGTIEIAKNTKIGYLAQNMEFDSENSIFEELKKVFQTVIEIEKNMRKTEKEMAGLKEVMLEEKMEEYASLSHTFENMNGYSYLSRIRGVIKGLGFTEEESEQTLKTLSGGQKTRVALGKLLLSEPDLMFLDEPTNHLDIESVSWLEDYLRNFPKAVILVSHDRYFIDNLATKIIEIENKKSEVFNGNYSYYAVKKEELREIKIKQYLDNQKIIKHHEEVIKKLRSFNREKSIKRAESREKLLDKIEKVERPESLPEKMRIILTPSINSGNDILDVTGLSMAFGDNELFSDVSFSIKKEEKIALVGPNGIGKTTLFRIILDTIKPQSGVVRFGTNIIAGYYDQEQQGLNNENTIIEEISDAYPRLTNGEIRNMLAAFVFTGDDVFKTISSLSGGEKGRVSLAKLMLSRANFLLMDEPTNHLDLFSKEILENAIINYGGTCLIISHDRYFINKTASRILELTQIGMNQYNGNYSYYVEKKNEKKDETNSDVFSILMPNQNKKDTLTGSKKSQEQNTNSWLIKKENESRERKRKTQLEKIETAIAETESSISEMDNLLASEEVFSDYVKAQEIMEKKNALCSELDALYSQWEELSE